MKAGGLPRPVSVNSVGNSSSGSRKGKAGSGSQSNKSGRSTAGSAGSNHGKKAGGSSYERGTKVVPYRKPLRINIAMILFAVILIYVGYSVIRYATTRQVVAYEVRTGSLQTNRVYEGLALRDEEVVYTEYSGYVNYYSLELDRLAYGDLAATIDESGEVQKYLAQTTSEDTILSDADYETLAEDIVAFREDFDPVNFSAVYDFKTSLQSTIQKITNNSVLSDIESIANAASLHYLYTDDTGYIVYNVDGYEELTFEDLTISDFDSTNYDAGDLESNSLLGSGDPVYKLELSEDWSIVIRVSTAEEVEELEEEEVVKVRFLKNQYESWGTIGQIREAEDGYYYVELTFTNSMMTFATDRFINIELITDDTTGLKIPKSALVDDEFYVVPRKYVTTGASGSDGVLRRTVDEDGVSSSEFVEVTPYEKDGDSDNYYLDQSSLRDGDVLIMPDSSETLTLSSLMLDTLTGVYNINEGYADFKQVTKLAENDEYAIVKSNTTYGLREYDYIVLDASTMTPNEFIYE